MNNSENAPLINRMIYSFYIDLSKEERSVLITEIQTAYFKKYKVAIKR